MRWDDDVQWLNDLKIGDRVAISASRYGGGDGYSLLRVERMTATLFVLKGEHGGELRARRSTGALTGARDCRHLKQLTPEILEKIEDAALRRWLSGLALALDYRRQGAPTTAQLRAMRDAWETAAPKEE